jgi:hypothetical protein
MFCKEGTNDMEQLINKLSENHDLDKIMNIYFKVYFASMSLTSFVLKCGIANLNVQRNGQNKIVKSYTFFLIKGKKETIPTKNFMEFTTR